MQLTQRPDTLSRSDVLSLESIEDYLGPAGSRFFGAGYRRVNYRVLDLVVDEPTDERAELRAAVAVEYPADWSRKQADTDLRPHLSTIDVLILAARFAESALTRTYALEPGQVHRAWLRRVEIKAGPTPYEEGLGRVPVRARLRDTVADVSLPGARLSQVDCEVGNMRIRCEIVHEDAAQRPVRTGSLPPAGPGRLYGDGFAHYRQELGNVLVDVTRQRASAVAEVLPAPGHELTGGLEAGYAPSFGAIDSFVISLQLGQVLLYELDGLARADSSTLWMRQTTIVADTPYRSATGAVPVAASLVDSRLVTARGSRWRTAAIVGRTQG
ncbi:AvrD family protein, partial [Micromonosporaceae bacterium Da 78-11]